MFVLLTGCIYIDDAAHAARMAQAEALFDSADSASPDETGALDTGQPDSGDQETGAPATWEGSYQGTFTFAVDGTLNDDTCVGEASVQVNAETSPSIQGNLACDYGGAYDLYGPQAGTVEGVLADDNASGAVAFGTGVEVADTWSGRFTIGPPGRLSATFSGSTTCEGSSCTYEGSFSGDREE
jgi:hypothetical protein